MHLFRNRLKSSVTSAIVNVDIAVPVRRIGHHVERTALSGVLLTSPTPLHDLGPLVLGDDALYLKQEVIFRTSAERPVQEHKLHAGPVPLIDEQDLVSVVAGQSIR